LTTQYHFPLWRAIEALEFAVVELKTGAAKLAFVETCIVYALIPSGSFEADQLNNGELTGTVDPLTGAI
jgi:hypothetical protein